MISAPAPDFAQVKALGMLWVCDQRAVGVAGQATCPQITQPIVFIVYCRLFRALNTAQSVQQRPKRASALVRSVLAVARYRQDPWCYSQPITAIAAITATSARLGSGF